MADMSAWGLLKTLRASAAVQDVPLNSRSSTTQAARKP
jgi:hypothetical protein